METKSAITVYGADWCPVTKRTLGFLDRKGVAYDYVDIDDDREAASWVASQNGGKEKKPTLDVQGQVLTAPPNDELEAVLRDKGLLK